MSSLDLIGQILSGQEVCLVSLLLSIRIRFSAKRIRIDIKIKRIRNTSENNRLERSQRSLNFTTGPSKAAEINSFQIREAEKKSIFS